MSDALLPEHTPEGSTSTRDGSTESLAAIGDVLRAVIDGGFELTPVLEKIAERAAELCGADYSYVYLRDGDIFRLMADTGGTPEFSRYEREHPISIGRESGVGRVAAERRLVHISDVLADQEYTWREGQRLAGYRTILGVPIVIDDEVMGVVGLARNRVDPFNDPEIATISVFAGQTGVAVRLARLMGEKHEAAEREAAVSHVLQTMGRSSFDLQDLLDTVLANAVALCHADTGNIVRHDPVRDVYRIAAILGFQHGYREAEEAVDYVADRGSMIGRVLLERRPVHIVDAMADAEYRQRDIQKIGGYRTLLGVPLLRDGFPIGVIGLGRADVRPFSDREIALVSTFADQAALAIENARLFETVELQRTELARFAPQVASMLSSDEGQSLLTGHRREITALFCDLRGFTAFAETAEPEEVLGVLRDYHGMVGELVVAHGGTVEHFAGDGLMVFFNDPVPKPEHRSDAIHAALAMRERFAALAERWHRLGYDLGLGIGIAVGYATLGRIGFEGRYDYGAVGNVVILASRLSEAAGAGQILVSARLFAAVEDQFEAEEVDPLALKGFSRPTPVHNIVRSMRST
ncbi:MAG TPA: GAF domain-containing protein [Candidatus Limnocylindrales bacterium]|nr:GAF domain-containing protein [Candidatus Limnocylindrales bacterium]